MAVFYKNTVAYSIVRCGDVGGINLVEILYLRVTKVLFYFLFSIYSRQETNMFSPESVEFDFYLLKMPQGELFSLSKLIFYFSSNQYSTYIRLIRILTCFFLYLIFLNLLKN